MRLLISILIVFTPFLSFSQEDQEIQKGKIMIWGFVTQEGGGLQNAKVYVYADDNQIRSLNTDKKGRFEVDIDYDAYYRFEFYKRNYVKKKIEIDATEIPLEHQRFGHEWGGWEVELLRKVPGMDTSVYEFPVAKAVYQNDEANFGFDYTYMHQKEEEFKEAEKEQKKLIKEYEKEMKEQEKLYAELLKEANEAYDNQELEKALEKYKAVLEINASYDLALERRDEITAELERRKLYAQYKGEATAKEAGGELEAAIEFWRKAKPQKPESNEAQENISRLTDLMKEKEAELLAEQREKEAERMREEEAKRHAEREALEKQKAEEERKRQEELARQQKIEEEQKAREKEEMERLLAEKRAAELAAAQASSSREDKKEAKARVMAMDKKSDEFIQELAKIYPQGVTEEVEKFKNRTVYKRIVVNGNRGDLYEKVVYNYGGVFYFKDGESVDQYIWDKETVLD